MTVSEILGDRIQYLVQELVQAVGEADGPSLTLDTNLECDIEMAISQNITGKIVTSSGVYITPMFGDDDDDDDDGRPSFREHPTDMDRDFVNGLDELQAIAVACLVRPMDLGDLNALVYLCLDECDNADDLSEPFVFLDQGVSCKVISEVVDRMYDGRYIHHSSSRVSPAYHDCDGLFDLLFDEYPDAEIARDEAMRLITSRGFAQIRRDAKAVFRKHRKEAVE